MTASFKEKMGCWLHERWRLELALRSPNLARRLGIHWLDLCNRSESVEIESVSGGRICRWEDSSALTAVRIFPQLGPQLLRFAAAQWPFAFDDSANIRTSDSPEISVLIAIGGRQRLPQLLITLASLRAQQDVRFEIIVVELGPQALLREELPNDVRHIHAVTESIDTPFNKSWGFNIGARAARGKFLALQDGDFIVPQRYLAQGIKTLGQFEGVRPHRFIFYLNESESEAIFRDRVLATVTNVDQVVANNPTPMIVRTDSYWLVGGHDESFFGWGGEDVEFLSRLRTRQFSDGGLMPIIHVWHPAAPKKASGDRNTGTFESLIRVPVKERVSRLVSLELGGVSPQRSQSELLEVSHEVAP